MSVVFTQDPQLPAQQLAQTPNQQGRLRNGVVRDVKSGVQAGEWAAMGNQEDSISHCPGQAAPSVVLCHSLNPQQRGWGEADSPQCHPTDCF